MKRSAAARLGARPSGFVVVRTPLLPVTELTALSETLESPGANEDALERALERDMARVRRRLRELVQRPLVREALFVASPSLDAAIDAWLGGADESRARGVEPILMRYLARMAWRATPFGLFSGCTTGLVGEDTQLALQGADRYRRHTRLDMHFVTELVAALEREPAVRERLRFHPSNAISPSPGKLRFPEVRTDARSGERSFHVVSVEATATIEETLARAHGGATLGALAAPLVEEGVDPSQAAAFVEELLESQLLASELAPPLTGPEPLDALLSTLAARAPDAAPLAVLQGVRERLRALDAAPPGAPAAAYGSVADALRPLSPSLDPARLFHVDLHKPATDVRIGPDVVEAIATALDMARRLGRASEPGPLAAFREAFVRRYEEREVPLCEALDEEHGIGFGLEGAADQPSPLLDGLPLPGAGRDAALPRASDAEVMFCLGRALEDGRHEWDLADEDLDRYGGGDAELPDAFSVSGTVAARSPEALASGELVFVLHHVWGPSGATLLGRFCHGDPALVEHVRAHVAAEEALRPDAVFAEVVHLPEGRLGNILCRPLLRGKEIAYAGRSGAPDEARIDLTDLMVSVRRREVRLRSRRLGCEVIPRMSTAHNHPSAASTVYRFLCSLQQRKSELGWSWPGAAESLPFLPRVRCGKVVLHLARWRIVATELEPFGRATTRVERHRALRALRTRRRLPRWVAIAEHDNVLPLDLENPLAVETLAALVKGRTAVRLVELFPAPNAMVVAGPEGRYAHELIVPFVREVTGRPAAEFAPPCGGTRTFAPGSEWLFAKIYSGHATLDDLLGRVIGPLARRLVGEGRIDRWFFLRYEDPEQHLRLRLHGAPAVLRETVLPALHEALGGWIEDGQVTRVSLDTYVRELERYGGDEAMEPVEAIFAADSEAALALVETYRGDDGAHWRGRAALVGMHDLLEAFGYDAEARLRIAEDLAGRFAREHRAERTLERALGARFRSD